MKSLALLLAVVAGAEPLRLGDDGFRIGQAIGGGVLSPDGRTFAVAGEQGGVYLLDAATGRVEAAWVAGPIRHLAFDGDDRIVTLTPDGWVRTYRARSGQPRGEVLLAEVEPGESIDGGFLAGGHLVWRSSTDPNRPRLLHDRRTGLVLHADGPDGSRNPWVGSPNGRYAARVEASPTEKDASIVRVLDRRLGRERTHPLSRRRPLPVAVFAPDGRGLLAAGPDDLFRLDLATGDVAGFNLKHWSIPFSATLACSPDGTRLAVGMAAGFGEWDLPTGKLVRSASGGPAEVGYTAGGRLLRWGSRGCRLDVRDADGLPAPEPTGHTAPLRSLAFADEGTLTTLDERGTALRWDVQTGATLHRARVPFLAGPAVRLDPAGRSVLVRGRASWDRFDVDSGRLSPIEWALTEGKNLSPDGRSVLERSEGRLCLRDTATDRTVALPRDGDLCPGGDTSDLRPVWSPAGDFLALDSSRTEVRGTALFAWRDVAVVETATGRLASRIRTPDFPGRSERGPVTERPVLFSPDGPLLVVRWRLGLFGIYDARTGRLRHHFDHPDPAGWLDPLAWSPDGRCLLCEAGIEPSGSELWFVEVATGMPRWRRPAPRGLDRAVPPCFGPDGRRIALALTDATVLLLPADDAATPASKERPQDAPATDAPAADWLAELEHDDFERREAARLALVRRPDVARQIAATATSASPHLRHLLSDLCEERLAPPARRPPP